jgi:pseudaminic acid cytidylyltransferase
VRPIAGVPTIARTIQTVIHSEVADRVVVSTDDEEIANVARAAGAEVPFVRPADLADDHAATAPVVAHAISSIVGGGEQFEFVLVVYPTAVLVAAEQLQAAKAALLDSGAELVMSVGRFPAPIERAWQLDDHRRGSMVRPEHALTRTQDLDEAFFDAGQFYFGTAAFWIDDGDIAGCKPVLVALPTLATYDIDTEEDFLAVENFLKWRECDHK